MAIHFILGGSGSGKSTRLYQHIIDESMAHPQQRYLVIVPEQFTLQTTREFVLQHPAKGILNIDVLSFHRLSYRVFEQTGAPVKQVLTETGKNLVLRRAAALCREDLPWLGARLDRQGYVSEVKSVLSELAQYEITGEVLDELIGETGEGSLLRMKLSELRLLQRRFQEAKEGLYITAEEVPGLLARYAPESVLLREAVLAFDSFTGFTPVQMTAIRALMHCARDIYFAFTLDEREPLFGKVQEHALFALSRKTVQRLVQMAGEEGIEVAEPVLLEQGRGRTAPGSQLYVLERDVMRYGRFAGTAAKSEAAMTPEGARDQEQIFLRCCKDPADEAVWTASRILALVCEEGYAFREIGVICSDLNLYAQALSRVLEQCHIPHFIDRKEPVLLNPCLELIRAAIEMAEKRFSYDSVMRLLRTGFAGIETADIDLLDNYLLAAGIRSWSQWKKPWLRQVRSLTGEELQRVDAIRCVFTEKMADFMEVFGRSAAKVADYTAALTALLERFAVQEQLARAGERLAARGEKDARSGLLRRAREYAQVYDSVQAVLAEAGTLLGDQRVSRKEFGRILDAGFDQARIGLLPPVLDQVYVGDLLRTRLGNIKALFFLGLNDGLVPARGTGNPLLSNLDREFLRAHGAALAPSMKEDAYIQRFYLYLNLTKPSRRLYLSWSGCDSLGKPLRPSSLIGEVKSAVPGLREGDAEAEDGHAELAGLVSPESASGRIRILGEVADTAAGLLSRQERSPGEEAMLEELTRFAKDVGESGQLAMALQGAQACCSREQLSPACAQALYREDRRDSVSRMDTYAACPFAHFIRYGLGLREREEFRISALDTGTLFHDALERFFRSVTADPLRDWHRMTDREAFELVGTCLEESMLTLSGGLFADTRRNAYTGQRVREILETSVWAMLRQIRAGSFTPTLFESGFYRDSLVGKIDRIDVKAEADRVYASLIDYKSGSTGFDLRLIYDGRSLQLPIYLGEMQRLLEKKYPGRQIIPAGIYYSHLDAPLVTPSLQGGTPGDGAMAALAEKELLAKLRLDGITNLEPEVLRVFSEDEALRRLIVPVPDYKKDGSLKAASSVATTRQLESINRYALGRLHRFREQIDGGSIEARPYRDGAKVSCQWCPCREACSFDGRLPGARFRWRTQLGKQEILREMEETTQKAATEPGAIGTDREDI